MALKPEDRPTAEDVLEYEFFKKPLADLYLLKKPALLKDVRISTDGHVSFFSSDANELAQ
jgi:hypothetical protein